MTENFKQTTSPAPVYGISEWPCYYVNYGKQGGKVTDIDECIELHLAAGIDQIVWNVGRSVVDYWSDLSNTTRMCELGNLAGGIDWSFVKDVMNEVCPLRYAMQLCRDRKMPILGRLGMNRHYGGRSSAAVTSQFAFYNPQFHERTRDGKRVSSRMCYGIEDVRQERIDILLEVQRIGVDALVLDFCRQMPMVMYHDVVVGAFIQLTGNDPRKIYSNDAEDYREWFQFRADVMTGFMQHLRESVKAQEAEIGRPCPIIARVPDNSPWLMTAYALDIERRCADDLIDGLMLSPLQIYRDDNERYHEYHTAVAHRHGKSCIGGIGSMNLIRSGIEQNDGFYFEQPVYELADSQYRAGADGINLYQSETLVRMDYLLPMISEIGDPETVSERARNLARPELPTAYPIGLDWHSRPREGHGLGVEFGDLAL